MHRNPLSETSEPDAGYIGPRIEVHVSPSSEPGLLSLRHSRNPFGGFAWLVVPLNDVALFELSRIQALRPNSPIGVNGGSLYS
jgi:hypothetical protein